MRGQVMFVGMMSNQSYPSFHTTDNSLGDNLACEKTGPRRLFPHSHLIHYALTSEFVLHLNSLHNPQGDMHFLGSTLRSPYLPMLLPLSDN